MGRCVTDFGATMETLRRRFIARAEDDLTRLREHRRHQTLERSELITIIHRLSGSAGLFGYPEISALAGEVETSLAQNSADETSLANLLDALEQVMANRHSLT